MDRLNFDITIMPFRESLYFITDFGAKSGGNFKNTKAINQAIEKCSKEGGGKVVVPRGIWYTGSIILKSNVNLYLEDGAVILFSSDFDDYPLIYTSWEGFFTYRCISPVYAENCENIAITGNGVIDGNGSAWRPIKKFKMTVDVWNELISSGGIVDEEAEDITWWPTESAMWADRAIRKDSSIIKNEELCKKYRDYLRPVLVNFTNCKNILLDGPTFQNSPAWCIHPWKCSNIIVKNINVRNPWFSQNGDGIDIDSCSFVKILDSTFDVGDDAICIKSGKNKDGRDLGIKCENVIIENCVVYHGHGGFVIGSEMSGGVKNIEVNNCTFIGTDTGIRFKSCIGRGGVVEDVYINNIDMTLIQNEAIIFTMGYDIDTKEGKKIDDEEIPEFKDITIENVNCVMADKPICICGLNVKHIHDINFKNINIKSKKLGEIKYADNINQVNVNIDVDKNL